MEAKKLNLLEDSLEMMEEFRKLPMTIKLVALAYAKGAEGKPFDALLMPETPGKCSNGNYGIQGNNGIIKCGQYCANGRPIRSIKNSTSCIGIL